MAQNCKVCWTCRGLFTDKNISNLKLESHVNSCNGSGKRKFDLFEYFVCDKVDYDLLINLKNGMKKCERGSVLSNKGQISLPEGIIKALLALNFVDYSKQNPESDFLSESVDLVSKSPFTGQSQTQTSLNETNQFKTRPKGEKGLQAVLNGGQKLQLPCCDTGLLKVKVINGSGSNKTPCIENAHVESQKVLLRDQQSPTILNGIYESEKELNGSEESVRQEQNSQYQNFKPAVNTTTDNKASENSQENLSADSKETAQLAGSGQNWLLSFDATEITRDNVSLQERAKLGIQCDIVNINNETFNVCKLCSHQSKSDKLMLRHLNSHNDGQPFECKPCEFSTIWRKDWKLHLCRSHKDEKYLCHICATEFATKDAFSCHISNAHSGQTHSALKNKLQCSVCDYVGRNQAALKEHNRKHTGEVIACPHEGCQFKSFYERSLNKHLSQKHAKEKNQICYVCGFQTRHASSLTKHMMLHRDFKPYKCAQCPFTALYPSQVISHAKSKHYKQKRFSCPKCSFQTSYPLAIQKHVERHEGIRGYTCSICGQALENMTKAKKHMVKDHGCTDYKIMSEANIGDKIKPQNYRIKVDDETFIDNAQNIVLLNDKSLKNSTENKEQDILEDICVSTDIGVDILSPSMTTRESPKNVLPSSSDIKTDLYNRTSLSSKGGNPMLSATTDHLGDPENSLIEDSLFNLMSDFPRPPTLNRCQSASTLMFASFSPHLIDRPLTPDFFTDSPSVVSFFPNFASKNLDSDTLALGNLSTFDTPAQPSNVPASIDVLSVPSSSTRGVPSSPVLPSFISSPVARTPASMSTSLIQDSECMDVDSVLPNSVLSDLSQLHPVARATERNCTSSKLTRHTFGITNSAFGSLNQDFSSEIQTAVASIDIPEEVDVVAQQTICMVEESPFPGNTGI